MNPLAIAFKSRAELLYEQSKHMRTSDPVAADLLVLLAKDAAKEAEWICEHAGNNSDSCPEYSPTRKFRAEHGTIKTM